MKINLENELQFVLFILFAHYFWLIYFMRFNSCSMKFQLANYNHCWFYSYEKLLEIDERIFQIDEQIFFEKKKRCVVMVHN